ncbi:hypothetical protein [Asanoa siamensis]|uniref:DUF5643 domain-containing protein n=1 Tax=Asanoa siamensis TaxID=926357 RepID=A0ABQ4D4W3_9ACTN|nr:hypothetical protein [Asanoa siamensis]GIF78589.1 hypothetical protein Asi02nite_81070 [Asanoa siamensis]
MSHDRVAHLLEQAIPGIPEELRRPPLAKLRARARRRRTRRNAAAAAVVTLVLAGPALWYTSTLDGPQRTAPAGPGGPAAAVNTGLTWWMARVDRAGTQVTLFVSRPVDGPACQGSWSPEATFATDAATVIVTVSDGSVTGVGCASDNKLATVQITLPEPLARRPLIDGYDDTRRPVYREADQPQVPGGSAGWSEVPTTFSAPRPVNAELPAVWNVSYTRPGGPDIKIRGYPADHLLAAVPKTEPVGTVEVAGTRGGIYPTGLDRYLVRWEAPGVVYNLTVLPTEGAYVSLPTFRELLARIGVS